MISPCPRCGYHWPAGTSAPCAGCGGTPGEDSLRTPAGTWSGLRAAFVALPRGLGVLVTTRGTKRWLVPPAVATFGAFVALAWWLYGLASVLVERTQAWASEQVPQAEGWWNDALRWLVERSLFFAVGKASGMLLATSVSFFAALWTFSLLYELACGPFLDEVHGRIEARWFGADPRDVRERPSGISAPECARLLALCAGAATLLVGGSLALDWPGSTLLALLASLGVFLWTTRRRPAFGVWLAWRAAIELRTLVASLQATALSALMLVFALPLLAVPLLGTPLFALAAGFTTSISLLDIPMSRRRWGLRLRLSFLAHHAPSVLAFGLVSSLVFLVPLLGPLLMVPAASVGGLWLFVKLDKTCLRPGPR